MEISVVLFVSNHIINNDTRVVYNIIFEPDFVVELWWTTSFPNVISERVDTSFPNVLIRHFRTC